MALANATLMVYYASCIIIAESKEEPQPWDIVWSPTVFTLTKLRWSRTPARMTSRIFSRISEGYF
jgi:hypothetical protein